MKRKNVTEKSISIRIDNRKKNYVRDLITIAPGEIVEVPEHCDNIEGLVLFEDPVIKERKLKKFLLRRRK